jgi:sugar fermentation stimulation protein A
MLLFKLDDMDCRIVRRVNRFVVEVEVEGRRELAHLNNSGRLLELIYEGNRGKCIRIRGRKLSYRLISAELDDSYALIDTNLHAKAFERSVELNLIPWMECEEFRRNVRVDGEIIDYLFCDSMYVELKSATLKKGEYAMYPDCPSLRGRRQIKTLLKYNSLIVFVSGLEDVTAFKPNRDADEVIAELLAESNCRAIQVAYRNGRIYLQNPDLRVEV